MIKKIDYKLIAALMIAGIISIFASSYPDGLEWVAEKMGFVDKGIITFKGFAPNYIFLGITNEILATALAGIFGTIFVYLVLYFIGLVVYKMSK